jgi:predicted DNA-binding protein
VIILVTKASLKKRIPFASTISIQLSEKFKALSEQTRITQSKLLDEAIEDLLAKYEKKGVN